MLNKRKTSTLMFFMFAIGMAVIVCLLLEKICQCGTNRIMEGETFCLSGTEEKFFYAIPTDIKEVFSYDLIGNKIYYDSDDYIVDYNLGTIRRTINSSIPDYSDHKVVVNKQGKFEFLPEPRNPELNNAYQIHVTYSYIGSDKLIDDKSKYLSAELKAKLAEGKDIRIVVAGDSIAGGRADNGTILL